MNRLGILMIGGSVAMAACANGRVDKPGTDSSQGDQTVELDKTDGIQIEVDDRRKVIAAQKECENKMTACMDRVDKEYEPVRTARRSEYQNCEKMPDAQKKKCDDRSLEKFEKDMQPYANAVMMCHIRHQNCVGGSDK